MSLNDRLYENYTSQHAGLEDSASQARVLTRDLLPHIPGPDSRCLDLGCGQGGLSAFLRQRGFRNSFGVDISDEQVAHARRLGRNYVSHGAAADYLQSDTEPWDVVTAFDFLEHLDRDDVLPTLESVRGGLAEGGVMVVRVPNAAGPLFGRYQYGDFTHYSLFSARSLAQLANAAGFSDSRCTEVRPMVHGMKSAGRRAVWSAFSAVTKLALAAESGQFRGHIVTSNLMGYLRA